MRVQLIFEGAEPLAKRHLAFGREMLAAQGKAVLYISHVLETVEQVCNRVIVIAGGKVLADAPPSELTTLMSLPNL